MEIEEEISQDSLQSWRMDRLRNVRYEPTSSVIFAKSKSILQKIYPFETERYAELSIRRTMGLPFKGSLDDLVWVLAYSQNGDEIQIGLESAYIFELSGSLITPRIVGWGGGTTVPLLEIVSAVLNELESLLSLQVNRFLASHEVPTRAPNDYMAVDHKKVCKLIVLGTRLALDQLENHARNYCVGYWNSYESMGAQIHFELGIFIYPSKRKWSSDELADLEHGDLVAIQNFDRQESSKTLRGSLRFRGEKFVKKNYEVFIEMNEEDTRLHFGSDELSGQGDSNRMADEDNKLPPHEQIELEIHAGKTKILFNELCSVQEGTLIELREHALPMVTLCVMGSPILEGELVHFQDQLMVQVTKRLD